MYERLPAYMSPHMCTWWRLEDDVGSPGTGVTDTCDHVGGSWELNLCPLEEQPVLLISEQISSVPIHIFMKLDDSMFLINEYYYGVDVSDLLVPLVIEDHHGCFYFGQV